jgi:DNA-directed RNA polymerase
MLLSFARTLLLLLLLLCRQGLDWLYVHLANVWGQGQDKLSFDGRRCAARLVDGLLTGGWLLHSWLIQRG